MVLDVVSEARVEIVESSTEAPGDGPPFPVADCVVSAAVEGDTVVGSQGWMPRGAVGGTL